MKKYILPLAICFSIIGNVQAAILKATNTAEGMLKPLYIFQNGLLVGTLQAGESGSFHIQELATIKLTKDAEGLSSIKIMVMPKDDMPPYELNSFIANNLGCDHVRGVSLDGEGNKTITISKNLLLGYMRDEEAVVEEPEAMDLSA